MKRAKVYFIMLVNALLILLFSTNALAWLKVCNTGSRVINVAIAYREHRTMFSKGWWVIDRNDCAIVKDRLHNDHFFIHAFSRSGRKVWAGDYQFCTTSPDSFFFKHAQHCGDGEMKGFFRVDVTTENHIQNLTTE